MSTSFLPEQDVTRSLHEVAQQLRVDSVRCSAAASSGHPTERCPQDRAFALLRSVSQNTNVKLRDLAATIVTRASGEPPRPTAPFEDG